MSIFQCNCTSRCGCALASVIAGIILGVVTAFLQITGVITLAPVFLWVALGAAAVYLAVLLAAAANAQAIRSACACDTLDVLLTGILGTILFAVILLAVGIVATSVISAILVGLLAAFLTITVAATACYVRTLADCGG